MGQKGNEDLFRYILKASNEMEDDEKRFQFVRNQVSSLEECMKDGPNKHATIKSLANWAVKEFTSIEKFKSDKRMLDLWKLLGKYSENMGMEGVLENLHRIGFFKDCPEFYLMWAEHWASKGKLENFNKIMQICKDNCPMSQFDAKELFKPLLIKYFDMENSLDGKTMDLIKMLADKPEDVRPELTLFPYERTIAPDPKHKDARKSQMLEGFEHHRQQRESLPPPPSTTNREEFSVFKDPTSVIHHQPAQSQILMQQVPEEPLQENKEKKGIEAQQRGNVAEEFVPKKSTMNKPTNPELNADKNQSKMVTDNFGRRRSFVPDLNDVTVAGSHGKFSSAMLTSTPRRSMNPINFDPVCAFSPHRNAELMFFDDLEQSKNKEGGLFGGVGTSGDKEPITGGSKLQKRLSLMPNEPPQQQIQAGEQNPFEGKNSIEDLLFFDDLEKSMNEEGAGGVGTGGKEKEPMTGGSKLQKRLSLIANEPPQQKTQSRAQNPIGEAQEKAKKIARPSDLLKTMPRLNIGSTIEEVTEEKENTTNTNSSFSSPFRKKTKVGGGDEPSECQPEESGKQQKEADN